ncbi:MAG: hypothetical protein ACO3A2_04585 [Bdellovibrionia bacterium]
MPTSDFRKEKYLQIAQAQGIGAALTQLQKDTMGWEYEAFEGDKGYQPQEIEALAQIREFARELWDMDLRSQDSA